MLSRDHNSFVLQKFSGKCTASVFIGCASCNTWTNVAITRWNTLNFSAEGMEFLKKMVKEDGLEEMGQWLGLLDHLTSTQCSVITEWQNNWQHAYIVMVGILNLCCHDLEASTLLEA